MLNRFNISRFRELAQAFYGTAVLIFAYSMIGFAPWITWIFCVSIVAFLLLDTARPVLVSPYGKKVLIITLSLLAVHLVWAVVRSHFYDPAQQTFWRDDHAYYQEAAAIATTWHQGQYPALSQKGAPPYLGTLHTGYHRPLATLFYFFGQSALAGLILNAVCAAVIPLLCAVCAFHLWPTATSPQRTSRFPLPLAACALAALHPTQFYWSAFLLKDTFTAFVVLTALALSLGAIVNRNPAIAISALLTLIYLFTVRAYAGLSIIAGLACLPLFRFPARVAIQVLLFSLALFTMLINYTNTGSALYEQLRDSLLALTPTGLTGPLDILIRAAIGIPRLFLSPYGWMYIDDFSPMYGLYPGMWYLYLLIFPLSFAGLHYAIQHNFRLAIVPIAVFSLAAAIFLLSTYHGNASRQRYYLEYIVILFAALGLNHPNKWWIGGILLAQAVFAIGQVISLST